MSSEAWELERRYSVPGVLDTRVLEPPASEDLHAWSIYRQNLNSDFTDSALGSAEKSPLPYGNFQLRDSTVQSILRHPRYGPKSPLANNSYTYLKFGLPRVLPLNSRNRDGSSGYDSSEEGRRVSHTGAPVQMTLMRSARSDPDFRHVHAIPREQVHSQLTVAREYSRLRSASEANLLQSAIRTYRRHSIAPIDPGYVAHGHGMLAPEEYTMPLRPVLCLQHPHLQLRGVEASDSDGLPLLRGITFEAGATDVLAIMATTEKEGTQIIETIAGKKRIKRGDILLNGRSVSARTLSFRWTAQCHVLNNCCSIHFSCSSKTHLSSIGQFIVCERMLSIFLFFVLSLEALNSKEERPKPVICGVPKTLSVVSKETKTLSHL